MEREIMNDLISWKESKNRKPLILQGVRQCGKTTILKEFGNTYYDDLAYFAFDRKNELIDVFNENLDPNKIIDKLSIIRNKKIQKEKTLIVFDEIQECPNAITALKYFNEEANDYHIVSCGSLLGLLLARNFSFPVGKVDILNMYPLSFKEFLKANNEDMICEYIKDFDVNSEMYDIVYKKAYEYYKEYLVVGGMPEVVKAWITNRDINEVEKIQDDLITGYELDFAKHADLKDVPKIINVWENISNELAKENKKFVLADIEKGGRLSKYESAISWLVNSGLVSKIERVEEPSLPLASNKIESHFKIYMSDVGILRRKANIPASAFLVDEKETIMQSKSYGNFKGGMIENFVYNELKRIYKDNIYYWRSNNNGDSEVEFIVQDNNRIIPIEVKAGKNLKANSLKVYNDLYNPKLAFKLSIKDYKNNIDKTLKYIPLFFVDVLKKF